jgi:tryptophan 2-monooxygenase
MTILRSFRTVKASFPTGSWPYIDTPDFSYDQWLNYLYANNEQPIGTVANSPSPTVAIIGAGVSGLCAAYELGRAGCAVSVFEQADQVGGRCASYLLTQGNTDIAEMGSMRFPPSEFILDYYLKTLGLVPGGLSSLPNFPDPGSVNTYLSYEGSQDVWTPNGTLPPGFDTVNKGWGEFYQNGITINNGSNVLYYPAAFIAQTLASNDVTTATGMWADYIKRFGQMTFYGALYEIFSGKGVGENGVKYDIPGKTPWTFSDFDRFGALGVGSGGFGPLYPIGFTEIFRLLINGLESTQRFLQPSQTLTDGIRSVPNAFSQNLGGSGVNLNTPIASIIQDPSGRFQLNTNSASGPVPVSGLFDRVIIATTTRAMELTTNVTSYAPQPNAPLLAADVTQAIMRTHVVSSNKLAVEINNFWSNNSAAVRCLQTDTLSHQVYTLDYTPVGAAAPNATGMAFISYVWDDDAVKQQSITSGTTGGLADAGVLFQNLMASLEGMEGQIGAWAQNNLQPLNGGVIRFEEWQSDPYFGGAFKLSQPGQDTYVQQMFFDYQKANTALDTGVYIAGDCIAWNSGWVEGGLQTALNAAAGVIHSLGGTLNSYPSPVDGSPLTPLTINANRYSYT